MKSGQALSQGPQGNVRKQGSLGVHHPEHPTILYIHNEKQDLHPDLYRLSLHGEAPQEPKPMASICGFPAYTLPSLFLSLVSTFTTGSSFV